MPSTADAPTPEALIERVAREHYSAAASYYDDGESWPLYEFAADATDTAVADAYTAARWAGTCAARFLLPEITAARAQGRADGLREAAEALTACHQVPTGQANLWMADERSRADRNAILALIPTDQTEIAQ